MITAVSVQFNCDWGIQVSLCQTMNTKPGYVEPPSMYRCLIYFWSYVASNHLAFGFFFHGIKYNYKGNHNTNSHLLVLVYTDEDEATLQDLLLPDNKANQTIINKEIV